MNKRYNIALRPISQENPIIVLANSLTPIADKYQLGHRSLPHVTLYQFQEKEEKIKNIWKDIHHFIKTDTISLTFEQFSFITFDNNIFWISLLPSEATLLKKLHQNIATIINKEIKDNFDPHMTLINSRNKDYQSIGKNIIKDYKTIKDCFRLSIGISDEIGQYQEDIY